MQLPKYVYSRLVKIDSPYQQMQSFLSPPPPPLPEEMFDLSLSPGVRTVDTLHHITHLQAD